MIDHYRYEYRRSLNGIVFRCEVFKVLRETPQGYWIVREALVHYGEATKRWVSKNSRKRYAYPTKQEAYDNVLLRKNRRLVYLKSDIKSTEAMVTLLSRCTVDTIEEASQLGDKETDFNFFD